MSSVISLFKHAFRGSYNGKPSQQTKEMGSFYALKAKSLEGEEVDLKTFDGKVSLVINVACMCGYTKGSYPVLVTLQNKYHDKGFNVLAFPCSQFAGQEYDDPKKIREFTTTKYKVDFPIFEKIDVNGPNTHPVYQFLKKAFPGDITWNFSAKFLVDRNGFVSHRFEKEDWSAVEDAIETLLKAEPGAEGDAPAEAAKAEESKE